MKTFHHILNGCVKSTANKKAEQSLLSTPHKYVFSDPGVRISGLNPQYEKSRIPAKEISEANLFLQRWLVDQVAKHCWNDLTKGVERLAVDPNAPPGVTF